MISEAKIVEIRAFLWNEGEQAAAFHWEGKPDYESVRQGLCDALNDGAQFGKLVLAYPNEEQETQFEMYFRAFDDEHRGRQVVAGVTPEELDKSFIAQRNFCAQKVFTPKELYALTPVQISKWVYHFVTTHLREEIDSFDADFHSMEASGEIEIHKLVDDCPDGRRTWTLETIWFKGEPVMVVNSSGRDGDEYHSRWITNLPQFVEMVKYMKEFIKSWEVEGLISEDTVIPAMTEFYNGTIHDYYDVEKQVAKS